MSAPDSDFINYLDRLVKSSTLKEIVESMDYLDRTAGLPGRSYYAEFRRRLGAEYRRRTEERYEEWLRSMVLEYAAKGDFTRLALAYHASRHRRGYKVP